MKNERLNDPCEIAISNAIKRLLKVATEELDLIFEKHPQYTSTNLLLNMGTGFLCCIAHKAIPKEARDIFIERLKDVVTDNFKFMDGKND